MILRRASPADLDSIYLMGFDVWSDGSAKEIYLEECRNSPKYKRGMWFVLSENNQLLSSLIVYDFGNRRFGIGSIATPPELRKKGYASNLIRLVLHEVERLQSDAIFFLYSDIRSEFYERFGFTRLDPAAQRYKTPTCMVRATDPKIFLGDKAGSPEYF